jgi:hypothetical protein
LDHLIAFHNHLNLLKTQLTKQATVVALQPFQKQLQASSYALSAIFEKVRHQKASELTSGLRVVKANRSEELEVYD